MTNDAKIEHVRQRIAARREQAKALRARLWGADPFARENMRDEAHGHESVAEGMEIALAVLSIGGEDELVVEWYREMRGYMSELYPGSDGANVPITVVGLSECYGARCSVYACLGITPVEAMNRLRAQVREAVEKNRVARRAADTEPTAWVPVALEEAR